MSKNSARVGNGKLDSLFLGRWSPRSFSKRAVTEEQMQTIFEAARWSPSCYNDQPWLFLYATDGQELSLFKSLLVAGNQAWANSAPAIAFILCRKDFAHNGKPNKWAEFDAGAAWMSLAMQARMLGLYTHAMAGIEEKEVHEKLGVPENEYRVIAAIAIGYMGDAEELPDELKKMEQPNGRNPLAAIIRRGKF